MSTENKSTAEWHSNKCSTSKSRGIVTTQSWSINIYLFDVHGSVHRESMSVIVQQDETTYSLLYFCKLLYMVRVVTPPIIRSTYNCNYSIWHWSNFGKCSVWNQLPSLLHFAIAEGSRDCRAHTSHL